jgi:hypothetical protein
MIPLRIRAKFRRIGLIASAVLAMLTMFDSCSALRLDQSAEQRMSAVEIGLDPPVVIAGEPIEKWTIAMQMRRLHVSAVSVAVINDYKIDWTRAWGVTEAGGNKPATSDTLFQAASISKPVASMAAMRLAQDGRLNLDANVNDYLKTWKVPDIVPTTFTYSVEASARYESHTGFHRKSQASISRQMPFRTGLHIQHTGGRSKLPITSASLRAKSMVVRSSR